jgi:hypothetical protein
MVVIAPAMVVIAPAMVVVTLDGTAILDGTLGLRRRHRLSLDPGHCLLDDVLRGHDTDVKDFRTAVYDICTAVYDIRTDVCMFLMQCIQSIVSCQKTPTRQ